MTRNEVGIYFNWVCNALTGMPGGGADQYLQRHLITVKKVAASLLKEVDYFPKEIYRGIIMKEDKLAELKPHKNFTYLSFTDDMKIALTFAHPEGFGAQYGLNYRLGKYGYIAKYTPKHEEVLFHHSILEILPITKAITQMVGSCETTETQKEVMIIQPETPFALTQLNLNQIIFI